MDCPDRELMSRMAGGDQEALSELMRRHHRRVYRVAVAYLRDVDEAMDVVQEAFVKAFLGAGRWDGAAEVTPWLTRIAINESIDRYRRRRRRQAVEEPLTTDAEREAGWAAPDPSPERRTFGRELQERIDQAVSTLPERQRAIFVLRHYEEMELREIARALGLRLGTVKSGLHRALHRLRELLGGVGP